jgi:hypothetical protein
MVGSDRAGACPPSCDVHASATRDRRGVRRASVAQAIAALLVFLKVVLLIALEYQIALTFMRAQLYSLSVSQHLDRY